MHFRNSTLDRACKKSAVVHCLANVLCPSGFQQALAVLPFGRPANRGDWWAGVTDEVQRAAKLLWDFHCVYDDLEMADVIIGLCSYDLRVADRCAELYHAGYSRRVAFTGYSGNWTQGLFPGPEAEAFAARAKSAGMPSDAIVLETSATNIGENVTFTARLMPGTNAAIFVTKPQTQRRCQATVSKQWPGVKAMITAPLIQYRDQPTRDHDKRALICEMVGDLERLKTYPAHGFQSEVEIPESVLRAFRFLKSAGYKDHLSCSNQA